VRRPFLLGFVLLSISVGLAQTAGATSDSPGAASEPASSATSPSAGISPTILGNCLISPVHAQGALPGHPRCRVRASSPQATAVPQATAARKKSGGASSAAKWGGVCKAMTEPEEESEEQPQPLPCLEAEPATGVAEHQATLRGTVNAHGLNEEVYFRYQSEPLWITEGEYEYNNGEHAINTSPISISGSSNIPIQQAITGLSPGTTYYFRVEAGKVFEDEEGSECNPECAESENEVSFTTPGTPPPPPPPTVTTGSVSHLGFRSATLEGAVNPNGQATEYWFEWGTSQSYGHIVPSPHGNAGSGTEPRHVSASIAELEAGTTYHYRLVAKGGSTAYGEDRTFTTDVSIPSAVVSSSGTEFVYFRGENGGIWQATPAGVVRELGGHALGNPAAVALSNGERDVYFRSTDDSLRRWYLNPSNQQWSEEKIGYSVGSSPSVSAAKPYVITYQLSAGCIQCLGVTFFAGEKWNSEWTGGQLASTPTTVELANHELQAWWVGADGALWYSHSSEPTRITNSRQESVEKWPVVRVGSTPTNEKPAVVPYPSGKQVVYFQAREGCILCDDRIFWNGTTWVTENERGVGQLAGGPVAAVESETEQRAYWRGSDAAIWTNYGNPLTSPWNVARIGGQAAGTPGMATNWSSSIPVSLYYFDKQAGLTDLYWEGSSWHFKTICTAPCSPSAPATAEGTPSAVTMPDGSEYVYFRGPENTLWQADGFGGVKLLSPNVAGSPVAVGLSSGERDVYFRATNGSIWRMYFNPATQKWSSSESIGGVTVGEPTVSAAYPYSVFYRQAEGCQHCIYQSYYSAGWHTRALGGDAEGIPMAVTTAGGVERVFWTHTGDDVIWEWYAANPLGSWTPVALGGTATDERPAPVSYSSGHEAIFFQAREGCILCDDELFLNGSGVSTKWGVGQLAGGPVAASESEGEQRVFWRGSDHAIWFNYGDAAAGPWNVARPGGYAAGNPSLVYTPGKPISTSLYYFDESGGITDLYEESGKWQFRQFCSPCSTHSPAAPSVSGVAPSAGLTTGGTSVTITGSRFAEVSAVKFGSVNASSYTVNSSGSITATAPAHAAGEVDVTVTTPGGTSPTGAKDQFTYVASGAAPTVTKLVPARGDTVGGTEVAITGTGFSGVTAVKFGTTPAQGYTVTSATKIAVIAPAAAADTVDVTVTTANGTSAISTKDHFKFMPVVEEVEPSSGPAAGGTQVTVRGSGFLPGSETTIKFGTKASKTVKCGSTTSCTATTPAHEAGEVEVKATANGVTSQQNGVFTFE
jgi:hypothetical protein